MAAQELRVIALVEDLCLGLSTHRVAQIPSVTSVLQASMPFLISSGTRQVIAHIDPDKTLVYILYI